VPRGQKTLHPVDADGFKVCSKCGERKLAETAFTVYLKGGGYRAACKVCVAERLREWRRKNRARPEDDFARDIASYLAEDD
jgi:ribosomal protein L32